MDAAFKVNRERVVVLGWGRAILLQLAHPLVGAAVAEHSGFASQPFSRLGRLHATVEAMLAFSFGGASAAERAADRINSIHRRVHGRLAEATGRYPAGTWYSATDPSLLRWVHATLLESVPLAYERFVGPLSALERDEYCARSMPAARLLGIPEQLVPQSAGQLEDYIGRTLASGEIEVTAAARRAASQLLYPPLVDPTRPAAWMTRLVTVGMLPPAVREAFGFPWSDRRERALDLLARSIRRTLPLLPSPLRFWRAAREQRAPRPGQRV